MFTLEDEALAQNPVLAGAALGTATDLLLEGWLAEVSTRTPAFAQALRGYRAAGAAGDTANADALAAWLGGQPHVAAGAKRAVGVKGNLDHFGAMAFLQGLLIDEVDAGRFPRLCLVINGTPAFFDGRAGVGRLAPLAQRLVTDFTTNVRFDNPRAVQVRLAGFHRERLVELGVRVRDLYAGGAADAKQSRETVNDGCLPLLADAVTGSLGGRVGVAPRIFVKKLVVDVLDRVDQFADFDPRQHYAPTILSDELTDAEKAAAGRAGGAGTSRTNPDDIEL